MNGPEIIVWTSAVVILVFVLNLVRRRRLREEYSWLWLAAAVFYFVMVIEPDLIKKISSFIGTTNMITTFIFFSLFFIILILINYSVKLSTLTTKMKDVAQMIALIEAEQNELESNQHGHNKVQTNAEDHTAENEQGVLQPGMDDRFKGEGC